VNDDAWDDATLRMVGLDRDTVGKFDRRVPPPPLVSDETRRLRLALREGDVVETVRHGTCVVVEDYDDGGTERVNVSRLDSRSPTHMSVRITDIVDVVQS
jgi:hypothetical protein